MFARLSNVELKVVRLITSRHLSCGSLAKELKVSRATAAKLISSLRKKRLRISTRRDAGGWFYELLAQPDPGLADLIGAGGLGGGDDSTSIDQNLVEHLDDKAQRKEAVVG